jgi:hypothetical protein
MDGRVFDELTRNVARATTRRTLLRGLIGGGAAIVAAKVGTTVAQPAPKVDVCHWDEDLGEYVWINISENAWVNGHDGRHENDYLKGEGCCTASECDDGIACTVDTCEGGVCVHTPDNDYCDDGIACTEDRCRPSAPNADPVTGCAHAPNNAYCDDENECTNDRCAPNRPGANAETGCANEPRTDELCDDGEGTCNELGVCVPNCVEPATCTADSQCCDTDVDRICVRTGGGPGTVANPGACRDFCVVNGGAIGTEQCDAPIPTTSPTTGTAPAGLCCNSANRCSRLLNGTVQCG